MKLFELRRSEDESGVSGTGTVAQGVIFDNGWCALTWLTEHTSVTFYTSIEEVVAIHGHEGKTRVIQIADCDNKRVYPLQMNMIQDRCENVFVSWNEPNQKYILGEREKFAELFRDVDLDGKGKWKISKVKKGS